jgi:hypothetical protein
MSDGRIWTPQQIASRERSLEERVSTAQTALDEARKWHRTETLELRKFRRAKAKYEAEQQRAQS